MSKATIMCKGHVNKWPILHTEIDSDAKDKRHNLMGAIRVARGVRKAMEGAGFKVDCYVDVEPLNE